MCQLHSGVDVIRVRSVSLLAAGAVLLLALSGCAGGSTDPISEGGGAASTPATAQDERSQARADDASSVPAGWIGGEYELNAVLPRVHTQSPKVRAFVDFLLEHLNLEIDYMSAHCPLMMAKEAKHAHEQERDAEETAAVGLRILEAVTA